MGRPDREPEGEGVVHGGIPGESALEAVLGRARNVGFLGPGPVQRHVDHALAFRQGWVGHLDEARSSRRGDGGEPNQRDKPLECLDLGSGGGLPGLVLAHDAACRMGPQQASAAEHWTLLESSRRRVQFLREAVVELGLEDLVMVLEGRAEDLAHRADYREAFDVVTSRGFGRPAITAECGRPFLRLGGRLVVSEPPGGVPGTAPRWPAAGLEMLGLEDTGPMGTAPTLRVLEAIAPCPARFPRRVGVPAKRPLF